MPKRLPENRLASFYEARIFQVALKTMALHSMPEWFCGLVNPTIYTLFVELCLRLIQPTISGNAPNRKAACTLGIGKYRLLF